MADDVVLPGWKLIGSFFNYRNERYNTSFGSNRQIGALEQPEMGFNIIIKRDFLGPFISNIVPLLVISILLFTVVTTATADIKTSTRVGFNSFAVLELAAAFLFVAILAQIDLRKKLEVDTILYMDYFYFMIYLVILLYSVNSVLFTKESQLHFIHYKNNLYPRLLYWPVFAGGLLLQTYILFL